MFAIAGTPASIAAATVGGRPGIAARARAGAGAGRFP